MIAHGGTRQDDDVRAAASIVCLLLAGCSIGGGEDPEKRPAAEPARAEPGPGAVRVVRDWADRLRGGDVEAASRTFAVPALVQNGGEPQRLESRAEVRLFNESLPCGARFVRSQRIGRYVVATFRLTHRPGVRCDGPGGLAATAFLVRGGKIVEWRRVGVPSAEDRELSPADSDQLPV